MALLSGCIAVGLVFCLALARAASRPMPLPDTMEIADLSPDLGYEDVYEPAVARLKPTFAHHVAVPS